jgi:hypothetical protein
MGWIAMNPVTCLPCCCPPFAQAFGAAAFHGARSDTSSKIQDMRLALKMPLEYDFKIGVI